MYFANEISGYVDEDDDANIDDKASGRFDENNNGTGNSFQPDIFDPRTWNALDPQMIDILVQKGPKRYLSIEKGLKGKFLKDLLLHHTL